MQINNADKTVYYWQYYVVISHTVNELLVFIDRNSEFFSDFGISVFEKYKSTFVSYEMKWKTKTNKHTSINK